MATAKPAPVNLRLDPAIKNTANLHAYIVDQHGNITEAIPFKGAEAALKSASVIQGHSKIYIGQAIPAEMQKKANERLLLKAGAYQVVKNLSSANTINIQNLPGSVLTQWHWGNCLITGHVHKNFVIDGQPKTLPVCHARVHICEIELEWPFPIIRPPIAVRKPPVPIPDPVILQIGQEFAKLKAAGAKTPAQPTHVNPLSGITAHALLQPNLHMQPLAMNLSAATAHTAVPQMKTLPPLQEHVMSALTSGSVADIRNAVSANLSQLHPYFCRWPHLWPWIYKIDEDHVVTTDCNGHFELWEDILQAEDQPMNIYVWVEVNINGQWVTVYRPPIPCNTIWNYPCNTEINVSVTDPRVMPCDCDPTPAPPDGVWFKSIGYSATALHIEQTNASAITLHNPGNAAGATLNNVGCTDILGYRDSNNAPAAVSPFGGTLNFRLKTGAHLPGNGITHYRWRRAQIADANLNFFTNPAPHTLGGAISRSYKVQIDSTHWITNSVPLGEGIGEKAGEVACYRIPYFNPSMDPKVDPADKSHPLEWDEHDFISASIESTSLSDGLHRFDLELGTLDSGGKFQAVAVPPTTFQVSDAGNSGNSVDAPTDYLNVNSGKALNFTIKVRIDNASCRQIYETSNPTVIDESVSPTFIHRTEIPGNPPVIAGKCGFIHYTDVSQPVRLAFKAFHPRNFATFSFGVVKGDGSENPPVNASGYVLTGANGYTLTSQGEFAQDSTVSTLLGSCQAGGQAAFSENLSVWALATDGTYRLDRYDGWDVKAFALSKT